jgi:hypothetical protein
LASLASLQRFDEKIFGFLDTFSPRHTQRDKSKQASDKRGNAIFMQKKNGKVPWEEEIKRDVRRLKAH